MPKNFLIIIDITSIAALSCAIYVILRYSYYFQATFSFQGSSIKKNQCIIFRDHTFMAVPKKFTDFYWPLQLKNLTESKIRMKYSANLLEK